MAKKIYIDKRVIINGKKSNINQDSPLSLNKHIQNVVNESTIVSENTSYDNSVTDLQATTVQDAIDEIAYTTTVVNISSAEILNLKNAPKQLLANPGIGKYYDIESIFFEYTKVGGHYTIAEVASMIITQNDTIASLSPSFLVSDNRIIKVDCSLVSGVAPYFGINSKVQLQTTGGSPKDGSGTIRAIIKYKIRTFGA